MLPLQKNYNITSNEIADLLKTHYPNLLQAFYESQSSFLCGIYKRYKSIETANIVLCFARSVHLEIIRQREKDLNFNVSLNNFWENFNGINRPNLKITTIVKITGIPKETVRRKINELSKKKILRISNINGILLGNEYKKIFSKFVPETTLQVSKLLKGWEKSGILKSLLDFKI